MKSLLAFALAVLLFPLFPVSNALAADESDCDQVWLKEGLAQQIPKYVRITLKTNPDNKQIVAANCEDQLSWWGSLRVFHRTGDRIDWIANLPEAYKGNNHGHYILSLEWRYLKKLGIWVLEVFDSSHMGNGSLWLFTLEKHDLRLLLHTTAVGHYWEINPDIPVPELGESKFHDEHLSVHYRAPKGLKHEAVFVTGEVDVFDSQDKKLFAKPYSETWMWNSDKRAFIRRQSNP